MRILRSILIAFGLFVLATGASAQSLTVTKTPWCGCCDAWVDQMKAAGFELTVLVEEDLNPLKNRLGVAPQYQSCHTAEVEGYVIEGHVPAEDVKRLLAEKPEARGLAVPGMPVGSPGMEMGSRKDPFAVLLLKYDGNAAVYSKHGPSVHNH